MLLYRFVIAVALTTVMSGLNANERATINGKVLDSSGKPIDGATIMVYEAGTKKGYSAYCPTCWADCGKHSASDAAGSFTVRGLDPDLWFTLLVVHDGYAATYVKKVDPSKGPAMDAVLKRRQPVTEASQVVRGRVIDAQGRPMKDALVEQQGVTFLDKDGHVAGSRFGAAGWIDQMVVTDANGEFEIAYGEPAARMVLQVSARGMAPKLFTESTGKEEKTMVVTEGAVIRGRLVYEGKPVSNAEVGLMAHSRLSGTGFREVSVGTKEDGTFALTSVPAGRIWVLYPKMESLAARNIGADVVLCETKDDGQEVNVGDIALKPAYRLRGRVTLSDGQAIPAGMHVTLSADQAWDSQIAPIHPDGAFEFDGLPAGVYSVDSGVKGYSTAPGTTLEVLINRDVNEFAIHLQPKNGQAY